MILGKKNNNMYKYGMKYRPLGIGCQPSGHVKYIQLNKKETGYFGFVFYDKPLKTQDVKKYELKKL